MARGRRKGKSVKAGSKFKATHGGFPTKKLIKINAKIRLVRKGKK